MNVDFYKNKKVFITGHTGFKGSWMCKALLIAGADVIGYSLNPPTKPSLFDLCNIKKDINSINGDIRNLAFLQKVLNETKPDIVIHMAAQPIVRDSYKNPVYTYETNVMGTVNILEAIRNCPSVNSVINVTTDKVYLNREWNWGYRENEELNGFDPYSNSKSCSELVTSSYKNSFFMNRDISVSTCRAGNVIGGGDFANDRVIPDCVRAIENKKSIIVRNPYSIRPYQHVMETIGAYLMIAERQYDNKKLEGCYNIGPNEEDCWKTGNLVSMFCKKWNEKNKTKINWKNVSDNVYHEANFLKLDCSKIKFVFGWKPKWHLTTAINKVVDWSMEYLFGNDVEEITDRQIKEYFE